MVSTDPCGGSSESSNLSRHPQKILGGTKRYDKIKGKMPLNKKIAVFDLDGTLTESKQLITAEMAALLDRLAERVIVGVISGASFKQFEKQLLPRLVSPRTVLGAKPAGRLVLLPTSGSQRYESKNNQWELVSETPFDPSLRAKVMSALREIVVDPAFGLAILPERLADYAEDRRTQITFSALGQTAPIEIKRLWDPDQQKRLKIKARLEALVPEAEINLGGTTSIDILPKGFNKAVGLKLWLADQNISPAELVFVGDAVYPGGNDYSVLAAGMETIKVAGPAETAPVIKNWLTD